MHEFHAWIGLAESAEESDLGGLAEAVGELEELAADSKWHDAVFEVRNLNGQYFLRADGMVNRRREEGERLDLFLAVIARRLPGSWGLVYERDDEMPAPPGPNAFRVRVLARGSVVERPDPFLTPVHPVIEDLPCSLYFPPRSPMLYAITRGLVSAEAACTDQIIYLVSSTQTLRKAGLTVVASSRHAELDYAEMSDHDGDLDHDDFVDWPLMTARYWNNTPEDPDRKERRQALSATLWLSPSSKMRSCAQTLQFCSDTSPNGVLLFAAEAGIRRGVMLPAHGRSQALRGWFLCASYAPGDLCVERAHILDAGGGPDLFDADSVLIRHHLPNSPRRSPA